MPNSRHAGTDSSRLASDEPARAGGEVRWVAALVLAGAVASLSVAAAVSGHEPVPKWSVAGGLVLAGFGFSAVSRARSWAQLLAGLIVGMGVSAIAAILAGSPLLAMIGSPVAAIVVVSGQALALMLVRVIRTRALALNWLRVAGCVALAASWVPLPYALVARHATVRVDHSELGAINDRAAGFKGIELGDTSAAVTQIMGPAPRWTLDQQNGPLTAGSVFDGPSSLDYAGPPQDTFLRYPGDSFAIRDGRVRWIQIDDQATATVAGLGPGDSLSLVRRFYPAARCGEDAIHSEPGSIAYPYCQLRLRPHRWLTFFASYQQPGTPVTGVWLTTSPLE